MEVFSNRSTDIAAYYAKVVSPINMEGDVIDFVDEAEHVGLLRSTSGNLPHLSSRISSHRKSLAAVLPLGLARGHRGNPAASLRIHQLYLQAAWSNTNIMYFISFLPSPFQFSESFFVLITFVFLESIHQLHCMVLRSLLAHTLLMKVRLRHSIMGLLCSYNPSF